MTNTIMIVISGAVAGMFSGGVAGWLVSRRRPDDVEILEQPTAPLDRAEEDRIDEAARQWASSQGMPEAADLISRKLRFARHLQTRQRGRMP
jgi:hypothetical protein